MSTQWWESMDEGQMYGRTLDPKRGHPVTGEVFALAEVPKRFRECSLDQIPTSVTYRQVLWEWAKNIVANINQGKGLLLTGDFGSGKTGAAVSILAEALHVGSYCHFQRALDLNEIYKSRERAARFAIKRIEKIQLLILDDVGAARDRDFGVHNEILERIVRVRYDNMLSTIITTNLTMVDFATKYMNISTILGQDYKFVNVAGVDWRSGGGEPCLV